MEGDVTSYIIVVYRRSPRQNICGDVYSILHIDQGILGNKAQEPSRIRYIVGHPQLLTYF